MLNQEGDNKVRFSYKILGRTPGVAEATTYTGDVAAKTPKEAMLAALVAEFGNSSDESKPLLNQLCDDGWVDEGTVLDNFEGVGEDVESLSFDTGDFTFDIEVDFCEGNIDPHYIDGAGDA